MESTTTPASKDMFQLPPERTGKAEFFDGEQVDLHASTLEQYTREAVGAAQSRHGIDPTDTDTRRVEFGGSIVDLAVVEPSKSREFDPENTSDMLAVGALIEYMRNYDLAA